MRPVAVLAPVAEFNARPANRRREVSGIVVSGAMPEIIVERARPPARCGIGRAVALGWQMAQLFHSPVHRGPVSDPVRGDHLPGRSEFPGASQSTWLGEQIQSQMEHLLARPPQILMEAMSDVRAALTDPDRRRDATLDAIFTLHCRLLEALTVSDFLLGKAYGLGRAIAETALLPANAITDEQRADQFRSMFETGRLITIKDWLADLKTLLPDHTAYAVSRSLHDWQQWVEQAPATADWAAARTAIRVQGRLWRELLTGEKAARDILSLSDYLGAGRRGTVEVLWRFWWVLAAAAILTGAVIYAGSSLHDVPALVRVVGSIAWLVGAAGLFAKGTGTVLGQGLTRAEGWLWQTELDGSVALAATCLPPGAKKSRPGGASMGRLVPDANRTTLQRRDQLRREAEEDPPR
jgi:hypothetical protein